jgi:hypothetical protein
MLPAHFGHSYSLPIAHVPLRREHVCGAQQGCVGQAPCERAGAAGGGVHDGVSQRRLGRQDGHLGVVGLCRSGEATGSEVLTVCV